MKLNISPRPLPVVAALRSSRGQCTWKANSSYRDTCTDRQGFDVGSFLFFRCSNHGRFHYEAKSCINDRCGLHWFTIGADDLMCFHDKSTHQSWRDIVLCYQCCFLEAKWFFGLAEGRFQRNTWQREAESAIVCSQSNVLGSLSTHNLWGCLNISFQPE